MVEKIRDLGLVKLVQLQPNGLIIKKDGGDYYDVTRRVEVDQLIINNKGIEATNLAGERLLDIHHLDHPGKKYADDDLVCIGFTSHYDRMRKRFGDHLVYGAAGENIIIDQPKEIWLDELGGQVAIENQDTGELLVLEDIQVANPCEEFSHFAARSQNERLATEQLKDILQFLGDGRRGFLMVIKEGQEEGIVRPGDKVFVVETV